MTVIPQDGRMTSFSAVPSKLLGDELVWLVQPGNANAGVLYNGTLDALAAFFAAYPTAGPVVVAALPSAITFVGTKTFVTDANTTLAAGIGTTVVGSGSNFVPVYSDGTNWIIG